MESQFRANSDNSHWELPSLVQLRNVRFQLLIMLILLHYLFKSHLLEVKKKTKKFQTVSSKSGRGRVREEVAYNIFHWETFGICWGEVVATGNFTVSCYLRRHFLSYLDFSKKTVQDRQKWLEMEGTSTCPMSPKVQRELDYQGFH